MIPAIRDDEAIRRIRSGDTGSYEVLAARYHRPLHRVAFRLLRNGADAEDAVQGAHLLALTHIDQYEGRSKYLSWMISILLNQARAQMRKGSRLVNIGDSYLECLPSSARSPEQQAVDQDLEHILERAVETLPSAYQPAFRLREIEDLTTAETGRRLGLTNECVKSRLFRARNRLRKRLRQALKGPEQPRLSAGSATPLPSAGGANPLRPATPLR